ncbi:hypothetical protein MUP46_00590 [Patescibacteria group bacterium]|nr:hypothetical protein [Patescibacteria group bacterium]
MNFLDLIRFGKKDNFTNFFDYPAAKRKKIIVRSARRGAELQLALVKRYEMKYGTK